jgi:hypothetical protein
MTRFVPAGPYGPYLPAEPVLSAGQAASGALHEWMSTEVPCADCATGWHEAVKCVNDSCPCDGDGLALGVPHSRPAAVACIYPGCGVPTTWRDGQGEWCAEHVPPMPMEFLSRVEPS